MKSVLAAAAIVFTAASANAQTAPAQTAAAQTAPAAAPAAKPAFSTSESTIGTLLDNPKAKAAVEKAIPGFSSIPQVDMVRGYTLRQVQQYVPDKLTDDVLAKVDAELAAVPAG